MFQKCCLTLQVIINKIKIRYISSKALEDVEVEKR